MSDSEDTSLDPNEYSVHDYYRLVRPLWAGKKNIRANYLNTHKLLRTLVDFSLSHNLLLKNLQKRQLNITDLSITKINYVDNLVIKFQIDSEYYYTGCFRNKFVEFCPHLAIASYLFSRFHIPDEYGSFEFSSSNFNLSQVKVLKGNNKLSTISYSQQHKSSINALSLSGLNYKDVNLTKLLLTQDFNLESEGNLFSKSVDELPLQLMLKLAGFENFQQYNISRNLIEPPSSLFEKIFPFINELPDDGFIKQLLNQLRKTLCQDMLVIKFKYPLNPLSQSEVFNSTEFENYISQVKGLGKINTILHDSCFNSIDDETESDISQHDVLYDEVHKLIDQQNDRINYLGNKLAKINDEQSTMTQLLSTFIENQSEVFQKQSEHLQTIQNSMNGLVILMSSSNKNSLPLVQQSLQDSSNYISNQEHANIKSGINNTLDLLTRLNNNKNQFNPMHTPTQIYSSSKSPSTLLPPRSISLSPGPSPPHKTPQSLQNLSPQQLERQKILGKRLSRQATTLFEMWDDFKTLEQELKDYDITVTEWLKVHGSSERQFRHTRLKIIKFVEEEATRRKCSVELIKERLHNKMRNRLRPWTLDEVQRMLTSNKRIDLDDTR